MAKEKVLPQFALPAYEGPLDLLLTLIQQEKVDIYDIPIARIADQFMETLRLMESMDLEVTSEFLVLAAQLLYIKSRELLPKPPKDESDSPEETDLKQDLVERLLTYQKFKQVSHFLENIELSSGRSYMREVDLEVLLAHVKPGNPLQGVTFADLWQAFCQVIVRAEKGAEIQNIAPEQVTIEAALTDILRRVILHPKGMPFSKLLRNGSRIEIIVSFLAILELLHSGKIRAEQITAQSALVIYPTPKAWEFTEEE